MEVCFGRVSGHRLVEKLQTELQLPSLSKEQFSPRHSGIVIAGFGSDEYFPTLVHRGSAPIEGPEAPLVFLALVRDNLFALSVGKDFVQLVFEQLLLGKWPWRQRSAMCRLL